jgi:hypothetical protein
MALSRVILPLIEMYAHLFIGTDSDFDSDDD